MNIARHGKRSFHLCQCEGDTNHGKEGHCWESAVCHVLRPRRTFKHSDSPASIERPVQIASIDLCEDCGNHYRMREYRVKPGVAADVEDYQWP